MKNKEVEDFLATLLYYVEEKKYPLPIAFKYTKEIKKVKKINYELLYELSREFLLAYHLLNSRKRAGKAKEFLEGIKGVKFPQWMKEELKDYINVTELENSLLNEPRWIRINALKGDIDKTVRSLETQGVRLEGDKSLPYMYKVISGEPKKTQEFKEYKIIFQDKASALVVEALKPESNDVIIDLSSAPGIKLSQIMALTENKAKIYAADVDVKRLNKEKELLKKMGVNLDNVQLVLQDSSSSSLIRGDKVLLDAPCSSSGMIANDPSILVNISKEKVSYYSNLQWKILGEILNHIKAEYAIYAVCSIFPEEGEEHTDRLFELLERPKIEGETGYSGYKSSGSVIRLFPHINNTEGFFISKIRLDKY